MLPALEAQYLRYSGQKASPTGEIMTRWCPFLGKTVIVLLVWSDNDPVPDHEEYHAATHVDPVADFLRADDSSKASSARSRQLRAAPDSLSISSGLRWRGTGRGTRLRKSARAYRCLARNGI